MLYSRSTAVLLWWWHLPWWWWFIEYIFSTELWDAQMCRKMYRKNDNLENWRKNYLRIDKSELDWWWWQNHHGLNLDQGSQSVDGVRGNSDNFPRLNSLGSQLEVLKSHQSQNLFFYLGRWCWAGCESFSNVDHFHCHSRKHWLHLKCPVFKEIKHNIALLMLSSWSVSSHLPFFLLLPNRAQEEGWSSWAQALRVSDEKC